MRWWDQWTIWTLENFILRFHAFFRDFQLTSTFPFVRFFKLIQFLRQPLSADPIIWARENTALLRAPFNGVVATGTDGICKAEHRIPSLNLMIWSAHRLPAPSAMMPPYQLKWRSARPGNNHFYSACVGICSAVTHHTKWGYPMSRNYRYLELHLLRVLAALMILRSDWLPHNTSHYRLRSAYSFLRVCLQSSLSFKLSISSSKMVTCPILRNGFVCFTV